MSAPSSPTLVHPPVMEILSPPALFLDVLEVVWNLKRFQPSSPGRRNVSFDPSFCMEGSRVSSLLTLDRRKSSSFRGKGGEWLV